MQNTLINYQTASRQQRRQIVKFIRKTLGHTEARDIIRGLHKAILKEGKLCGVATDISMIYEEENRK